MKAYDNVNWNFLLNVLALMKVPEVFIAWIRECITTPTFIIALNGELLDCFPEKKGQRQGDLISYLLFVVAMDILSKALDIASMNGHSVSNLSVGLHSLPI